MTNKTKAVIEEAADKYERKYDGISAMDYTAGMQEVIEHPERFELIKRYAYTAEVEHVNRLMSLLRDIDDLLMSLEDYTHGKDGHKITELRHEIAIEIP